VETRRPPHIGTRWQQARTTIRSDQGEKKPKYHNGAIFDNPGRSDAVVTKIWKTNASSDTLTTEA
jgi:hypothetical protein